MATAKKAAQKKPTEKWCYMHSLTSEAYRIYNSREAVIKAAKEEAVELSRYDNVRNIKFYVFKMDSELVFDVEVKEVPVMTKKKIVKERK